MGEINPRHYAAIWEHQEFPKNPDFAIPPSRLYIKIFPETRDLIRMAKWKLLPNLSRNPPLGMRFMGKTRSSYF
jgi:hypothetical protein